MATIINTLDNAIGFINSLYEADSTAPTSGDEDYAVWTALINIAINIWESEEGVFWEELFVKLDNASTGDKTASAGDYSYDCPDDFIFPQSSYVWIGDNTNKTAFKVIKRDELQLYENNSGNWCYFIRGSSPTLEFNPNCTVPAGTIRYNYYKYATKMSTSTDVFEMTDPMFVVYYALSELKKDEGDTTAGAIASQKLESMRTKNMVTTIYQEDSAQDETDPGFEA